MRLNGHEPRSKQLHLAEVAMRPLLQCLAPQFCSDRVPNEVILTRTQRWGAAFPMHKPLVSQHISNSYFVSRIYPRAGLCVADKTRPTISLAFLWRQRRACAGIGRRFCCSDTGPAWGGRVWSWCSRLARP